MLRLARGLGRSRVRRVNLNVLAVNSANICVNFRQRGQEGAWVVITESRHSFHSSGVGQEGNKREKKGESDKSGKDLVKVIGFAKALDRISKGSCEDLVKVWKRCGKECWQGCGMDVVRAFSRFAACSEFDEYVEGIG